MNRPQLPLIRHDLKKKMVFLTGPRQVGKTWLARAVAGDTHDSLYLNCDNFQDRAIVLEQTWLPGTRLLILDELHKISGWKNLLKGIYDTKPDQLQILVTGSARLDTFRQSGDSLAGRFFRHRLNPLALSEIPDPDDTTVERLLRRGGFPEPYLAETDTDADRWRLQYVDGLIRTDLLDFEKIHDFRAIQLTLELLRERVGSPVSYSSLARDVGVAPNTIKRYVEILEALFIVFRVTPHHRNIARSLLKDGKLYFYDTGLVRGDDGARFENMVAVSLLKHVNGVEDQLGRRMALHLLRTKEGREVDFVLVVEGNPELMIEAKLSDQSMSRELQYFHARYGIPAVQLVRHLRTERMEGDIQIRSALSFLKTL